MIQKQFYTTRKDGVNLYITYSDEGYFIEKIKSVSSKHGRKEVYKYAIDVENANYEYVETEKLIEHTAQQVKEMEEAGVRYWIPSMANVKVK